MTSQSTADTASAVADLQQKWNELHDLDRARAVHAIHQAGVSFRQLAKALTWVGNSASAICGLSQPKSNRELMLRLPTI
jgi:hypothetical protein